jgi:hypothetical protein
MVRGVLLYGLALLQAAAVQAVFVPADLPEGVYSIPFDSTGAAIGAPVLIHSIDSRAGQSRFRRQQNPPSLPSSQTKCGNNGNINISDFSTAKSNLESVCDKGDYYPASTAVVYTTGGAVAYFCNYGNSNRCWRQEYEEAMTKIVNQCGSGKGGEVFIPSYNKAYGGDKAGKDICL